MSIEILDRLREAQWLLPQREMNACAEAAAEIVRLREALDAATRTMNACIEDYGKLRKIALDGDVLTAYRLGVKHGGQGQGEIGGAA
jgi:hypothetical protein